VIELYDQCVIFMIHLANLLGVTYRDANAAMFFLLWPATTLTLCGWSWRNARAFRRLETESQSAPPPAKPVAAQPHSSTP
jgi:hypothetical protein